MMTRLLGVIGRLISLTTRLFAALNAVRLSGDCETCEKIVELAEKDYMRTLEGLFRGGGRMILVYHSWEIVQNLVLESTGDEEVVTVTTLPAAVREARTGEYDLALVDADTTDLAIQALSPYVKVVALTGDGVNGTAEKAVGLGAVGCVWLGLQSWEIALALEKYRKEGSPEEYKPLRWNQVMHLDGTPVGKVQLQMLEMVTQGLTSKQMAVKLGTTEGTVNQYLRVLYEKFGLLNGNGSRKTRLAVMAVRAGVV